MALPHRDGKERGETILPAPADDADPVTTAVTALDDLALALGATTQIGGPTDRLATYRVDRATSGWVPVALALGAATVETDSTAPAVSTVTVGRPHHQRSLQQTLSESGASLTSP